MSEGEQIANLRDVPGHRVTGDAEIPHPGPFARLSRACRDAWDVVRWTRSPLEVARVMLPLPRSWMGVRVLNAGGESAVAGVPVEANGLAAALAGFGRLLESDALTEGRVNYGRLAASPAYGRLAASSRALVSVLPDRFDNDDQRVAFWLNVYNTLSIHGAVAWRVRRSVMEMPSFFVRTAYQVGEHVFCLDDVSNGVLRRGAPNPYTGGMQFAPDDARLAYCPSHVDPRIHGALVCAAASCPPVAFYRAERLDAQLDAAASNLVNNSVVLDGERREVRLPLHFHYYERDFAGSGGVVPFILRHLDPARRGVASQAFSERWRIRWEPYDWALNLAR